MVSVIIPLYNVEKYIGECLDSLIAQTFTDFEVIVVDDCSTDSSPAIVQSYAEKFGGRLTYVKRRENFGGAAKSRNMGISLACGEYIQLIDNDDFLAENALEILYTAAKSADADVVYTSARYIYDNGDIQIKKSKGYSAEPVLTVDKPELLMQNFLSKRAYYYWAPWTKFVRKKFLVENEIVFPEMPSAEDLIWTIELLCCSRRFLSIPNMVYYWRRNKDSITRGYRNSIEHLKFWIMIITKGIAALDNLWSKYDVLKNHSEWLYVVLNYFFKENFMKYSFDIRAHVPSDAIYKILCSEFTGDKAFAGSYIPFLYSYLDSLHKQSIVNNQQFQQFAAQAQARIAQLEAQLKTK